MREMLGASLKMTHHANAAFIYCLLVKLGNFKILFVCLSVCPIFVFLIYLLPDLKLLE